MPNWCKNNLRIYANGGKVLEVLELLKDKNGEMTFEKFMPTPEELNNMPAPTPKDTPQDERDRLIEKYGAENWYDWRLKNWGVKWDASESGFWKKGEDWVISFETPWGPPIEFIQELSKVFKDMEFVLQYADESEISAPIGEAQIINGSVFYDGPEPDTEESEEFGSKVWAEEWVE